MKLKRQKYRSVRTEVDGLSFASKAEAELYQLLKLDPEVKHIDLHVNVTLPGKIRLNIDYLVWRKNGPEAVECKGFITRDFQTKRKLFDAFHPLAPLKVFKKQGNRWVNV